MMKKSSLFIGMLSFVIFTGCSWWNKQEESTTPSAETETSASAMPVDETKTTENTTEQASVIKTAKAIETTDEFTNVVKGDKPAVVKFYADWCGVCKEMEATFDEVAKAYSDKCEFVTVNIDKAKNLADSQNVKGVPTIVFFKKGEEIDRTSGKVNKEELETKIKETLEEESNQ